MAKVVQDERRTPAKGPASAATLAEIAAKHNTDKDSEGRALIRIYDWLLKDRRGVPTRLLEIGVAHGGSLRMWRDYFAEVELIGVELDPAVSQYASEGFTILIGDQSDPALLEDLIENHGPFDVVIDDGSHYCEHQIATLQALWPAVVPGGLYAVEDTHTSYFPRYHGGYRKPGAFMEYAKQAVDDPNQRWHQRPPLLPRLESVQVYPELCVFTKARELIYDGEPPNEWTLNHLNEVTA